MKISLSVKWNMRLKLYAQGATLRAKGATLRAQGATLRARGDTLYAQGATLWARGDALWAKAVLDTKGNIKIKWTGADNRDCELETGEYFRGDALKDVVELV